MYGKKKYVLSWRDAKGNSHTKTLHKEKAAVIWAGFVANKYRAKVRCDEVIWLFDDARGFTDWTPVDYWYVDPNTTGTLRQDRLL